MGWNPTCPEDSLLSCESGAGIEKLTHGMRVQSNYGMEADIRESLTPG